MYDDYIIDRQKDLVENPTARLPICLVLDISGSMSGDPINELNRGVQEFFDAVLSDEVAKYSAEVAIVTFESSAAVELDFESIEKQRSKVRTLTTGGLTAMGSAVNMSLDLLERRKKEYQDAGVDYYQPWLVLMTDGAPTDEISNSANRCADLVNKRKLTVFPVGIGASADLTCLARFSPRTTPAKLNGVNFSAFFAWLSQSVSHVSQSTPGNFVALPPTNGWTSI